MLFGCRGSTSDGGDGQLSVEALEGSGEPIGLQVDGAGSGVCEWRCPLEGGGLRQEGVDLTLRLLHRASGRVERAVAESAGWV